MRSSKLKKMFIMMIAFAVLAMLVFPVTSCFDDDDDEDDATIVGVWKMTKITVDGAEIPLIKEESVDCNKDGDDDVTFSKGPDYTKFGSDNTTRDFSEISDITFINAGECDSLEEGIYYCSDNDGTYRISGNTIIFDEGTEDESVKNYTLSGNTATISFEEEEDEDDGDNKAVQQIVFTLEKVNESEVADAIENCELDL